MRYNALVRHRVNGDSLSDYLKVMRVRQKLDNHGIDLHGICGDNWYHNMI